MVLRSGRAGQSVGGVSAGRRWADRPAVNSRLPRFVPLTLRAEMDKIRGQNTRRSAPRRGLIRGVSRGITPNPHRDRRDSACRWADLPRGARALQQGVGFAVSVVTADFKRGGDGGRENPGGMETRT